MNARQSTATLGIALFLTAGLLTWAVLGASTTGNKRAACDTFIDSGEPFYAVGKVTYDEGMKMAARRARRAARLTNDAALDRALLDFARKAEGRHWSVAETPKAEETAGVGRILFLCSQP